MIAGLAKGQEAVVRTAREVFPVAEKANDEATTDLLTKRMQPHEKTAWMLRCMLRERHAICAREGNPCRHG